MKEEALKDEGPASESPVPRISRRAALAAALLGGAAAVAKEAKAGDASCECLPAPDCNAQCPNGGTPRADGTQACDCNPDPCVPQDQLAVVARTGKYEDLLGKPDLNTALPNITTAGSAGPTADVTMTRSGTSPQTGQISIPYFKVDSKGRITAFGNRTFTMKATYYGNYANYYAYSNYKAYTNYQDYQNYTAYKNYYNYYNYYDACCGDSDGD